MYNLNYALLVSGLLLFAFQHEWKYVSGHCIDMEKHAGEVNGCCRMEPFFDEAIAEKCFHDVSAKFPPGTTDFVVCYIDCEYREMGLVTAHEDVDEAKYNSYHASFDPAYREAVARAVASCASIQDDIRRDVQSIGSSCSAFSFMYHMCVTRQVMIGYCPADRWNPSEICQMVKAGTPPCE